MREGEPELASPTLRLLQQSNMLKKGYGRMQQVQCAACASHIHMDLEGYYKRLCNMCYGTEHFFLRTP